MTGDTEISFNNLLDANAAFELVKEFDEPAAVVVKHINPCGCAIDEDINIAYRKAYEGDVVSAFGGIIAVNRPVDVELARTIMESYGRFGKALGASGFFAEVIIAPQFNEDAVEIIRTLKVWGSRVRLIETGPIDRVPDRRQRVRRPPHRRRPAPAETRPGRLGAQRPDVPDETPTHAGAA